MGGESTLVLLKEREEVYRANSKLKHFRHESSRHYIEATYGPTGVPIAHRPATHLFSARFDAVLRDRLSDSVTAPRYAPKNQQRPKSSQNCTRFGVGGGFH